MLEKLQKRAKRKFINMPLVKHLHALDSPLKKAYESTFACSSSIKTHEGKLSSRYCKRTWCGVCAPIRTAVRLNNYKTPLEALGKLYLTTLTIPNVSADQILQSIKLFRKVFRKFRDKLRKQGREIKGVYNFEITINFKTNSYHPHIHIIHSELPLIRKPGKNKFYNELCQYWLDNTKHLGTNLQAQDSRECYDLIEGFKYQALNIYKKQIKGGGVKHFIPAKELDLMYQQISGVRMFNSFGIDAVSEEQIEEEMDKLTAYDSNKPDGVYLWKIHDWQNKFLEIQLSDFEPNKEQLNYVEKLNQNKNYTK